MPLRNRLLAVLTVLAVVLGAGSVLGQTYLDLENQVQEFTLDNGVRFLVLENHDVPVFSFRTFVNVGSSKEVRGITGLSHILEHMAFKGTAEIGTNNYGAKKRPWPRKTPRLTPSRTCAWPSGPSAMMTRPWSSGFPADKQDAYAKVEAAATASARPTSTWARRPSGPGLSSGQGKTHGGRFCGQAAGVRGLPRTPRASSW